MPAPVGHDDLMLDAALLQVHLPLAGFGGAKALMLGMIIALPLILIVGTYMKRSRPR